MGTRILETAPVVTQILLNIPASDAHVGDQDCAHSTAIWDGFDAYLFDIDGTLLRSRDRIHFSSFAEALLAVTGEQGTLDGISLHGNTDTAILQELLRRHHIPSSDARTLIPQILEAMQRIVFARKHAMVVYPMPGVFTVLNHLRQRDRFLGVGTGNVESIGWLKLEVCGLREFFTFGAFCDHHAQRAALIAHGAEQARALAGSKARICIVGDTPVDIAAAHANSLPVLAVATGIYSLEELQNHTPEFAVSTLQDCVPSSMQAKF